MPTSWIRAGRISSRGRCWGESAGEVASGCSVKLSSLCRPAQRAASRDARKSVREELLSLVDEVFQTASERIYRMADDNGGMRGMATTGVLLVVGNRGAVLGHVGDSRATWFELAM